MRHLLRYLFLSYLFFLLSSTSSQTPTALALKLGHQCLHWERLALLQLQQESMSNSTRFHFWEPETDCCSWEGVTCDTTSGHVIGLNLSPGLSGCINSSSSLFRLRNLQRLNLAQNKVGFTPISSGFDRLPSLTHLNLSGTCSSGQIPLEISNLTRLVSLDLSNQGLCIPPSLKFDEQDPQAWFQKLDSFRMLKQAKLKRPDLKTLVQNLTSLRELYLDGVDISVQSSDWGQALAFAVPNLTVLSLSNCRLSGPIHSSLSRIRFLSVLRLDGNNLSIVQPNILENFSYLKTLSLQSCELHGKFPENIFRLPKLETLDVSYNQDLTGNLPYFPSNKVFRILSFQGTNFSGGIPESIGNLKLLIKLQLSSCNFSGLIPYSLANLTQLLDLDLSYNHFSGSIPYSLANLTQLVDLELSDNSFSGLIPPFCSDKVPNLAYMSLNNNLLDGTVRSSLFMLPSLQTLHLYNNQLSGQLDEFPDASFSSLEDLDLGYNQLEGQIPKSITQFTRLRNLYLDSNNFNSTVKLEMFHSLKNLSLLYLSDIVLSVKIGKNSFRFPQFDTLSLRSCHLNEFPDFIRNQEKLSVLDLSNNQLHGPAPHWIWKRTLTYLDLSGNTISYLKPPLQNHFNGGNSINNSDSIPQLSSLILRSCNLSEFPDFLRDLSELRSIDLSDNNIHGQIPDWIWKKSLQFLNLSQNSLNAFEKPLSDITSPWSTQDLHSNMQGSFCKLETLQLFDVSHNNLSGLIPECLGNITTLVVLDLQGNGFHRMPQNFTNSSSLRTLNINGNQIEGQLPRTLANCTMLKVLDLGRNKISDTFPFWLENLPLLRVLILRSNKFYGSIEHLRTNHSFQMLRIMDLSSNKFTGNLQKEYFQSLKAMMLVDKGEYRPKYIETSYYTDSVTVMSKGLEMVLVKILTTFTSLDLSNNNFQGEIPQVIGDLRSLIVLNLSRNDFMGRISSSIGNLTQLESLDLSQNNFSGEIPWQLTSLTFLAVLNLSQNHLEGSIPRGNQFDTFSNTSYIDNPGLCGFPLSRKCKDANDDMLPKGKDSQSSSEFDWQVILMGYGCGVVIGIVTGNVIFRRKDEWFVSTYRGGNSGLGKG